MERILELCGIRRRIGSWTEELEWAVNHSKGRSLSSTVLRLAWKALIYHVWRERNGRLHNQSSQTANHIFEQIKGMICIKIAGLKGGTESASNGQLSQISIILLSLVHSLIFYIFCN